MIELPSLYGRILRNYKDEGVWKTKNPRVKKAVQESGSEKDDWCQCSAEPAYAGRLALSAWGGTEESLAALEQAQKFKPDHPSAILTMEPAECPLKGKGEGALPFLSLLFLHDEGENLFEMINEAGNFPVLARECRDDLALFLAAAARFPGDLKKNKRLRRGSVGTPGGES